MAIKCGNCKKYHDNIQEVMDCHGNTDIQEATARQLSYLGHLMDTRAVPDSVRDMAKGALSKSDASKLIDQALMAPVKKEGSEDKTVWEPDIAGSMPKPGTYTVVMLDDTHITVRIRKPHPKANFMVAEYLWGRDNTNDFKRFAREVQGGFRVVPGHSTESNSFRALKFLMAANKADLASMGFEYALKSGNCYRCGRKLTVPASINQGLGPVCAGKE